MEGQFLYSFGGAFLGGILLNVMPCVLPVLTMKVFHVLQHGKDDQAQMRAHGIAYTAGVMVMFLILAVLVIGLRASGELVGWGMQFQNPSFVAALTILMVVFGLNALGVFEFTVSVQGGSQKSGLTSSFVNGIVASLMSTPCSAPFLGGAAAFALGSGTSWWETLALFLNIGFGLAAPFLLISFVPAVSKILPKPGAWMNTFKHLMGFTLLGAAVWLYGVLQQQISPEGSQWFLGFLVVIAMALWGIDHFGGLQYSTRRRVIVRLASLAIVGGCAVGMLDFSPPLRVNPGTYAANEPVVINDKINWAPFDSKRVKEARTQMRPVFMDYTADWCTNCKANEKAFIEVARFRETLQTTGIMPMKADLTNDNEEIWTWLGDLGRKAIPAYVIYMPDGTYDLLPVAITTDMLVERLTAASKKYPPSGFQTQTASVH